VTIARIPATVLELLGHGTTPDRAPSLRPLWQPQPPDEWPLPLIELARRPWEPERSPVHHGSMRSIVTPRWHFIRHETFGPELYDVLSDPLEQRNVLRTAGHEHLLRQFIERLPRTP
jgi:hypothetical protein